MRRRQADRVERLREVAAEVGLQFASDDGSALSHEAEYTCVVARVPTGLRMMAIESRGLRRKHYWLAGRAPYVVYGRSLKDSRRRSSRCSRSSSTRPAGTRRPASCGEPGWEEVADYALDWAVEHAGARLAAPSEKAVN